jgi:hypothetical protein
MQKVTGLASTIDEVVNGCGTKRKNKRKNRRFNRRTRRFEAQDSNGRGQRSWLHRNREAVPAVSLLASKARAKAAAKTKATSKVGFVTWLTKQPKLPGEEFINKANNCWYKCHKRDGNCNWCSATPHTWNGQGRCCRKNEPGGSGLDRCDGKAHSTGWKHACVPGWYGSDGRYTRPESDGFIDIKGNDFTFSTCTGFVCTVKVRTTFRHMNQYDFRLNGNEFAGGPPYATWIGRGFRFDNGMVFMHQGITQNMRIRKYTREIALRKAAMTLEGVWGDDENNQVAIRGGKMFHRTCDSNGSCTEQNEVKILPGQPPAWNSVKRNGYCDPDNWDAIWAKRTTKTLSACRAACAASQGCMGFVHGTYKNVANRCVFCGSGKMRTANLRRFGWSVIGTYLKGKVESAWPHGIDLALQQVGSRMTVTDGTMGGGGATFTQRNVRRDFDFEVKNKFQNCWGRCGGKRQGSCDGFCGKGGMCCRYGYHDKTGGCTGKDGDPNNTGNHVCSPKPRPAPSRTSVEELVFDAPLGTGRSGNNCVCANQPVAGAHPWCFVQSANCELTIPASAAMRAHAVVHTKAAPGHPSGGRPWALTQFLKGRKFQRMDHTGFWRVSWGRNKVKLAIIQNKLMATWCKRGNSSCKKARPICHITNVIQTPANTFNGETGLSFPRVGSFLCEQSTADVNAIASYEKVRSGEYDMNKGELKLRFSRGTTGTYGFKSAMGQDYDETTGKAENGNDEEDMKSFCSSGLPMPGLRGVLRVVRKITSMVAAAVASIPKINVIAKKVYKFVRYLESAVRLLGSVVKAIAMFDPYLEKTIPVVGAAQTSVKALNLAFSTVYVKAALPILQCSGGNLMCQVNEKMIASGHFRIPKSSDVALYTKTRQIGEKCHEVLKPINDGPMELINQLGAVAQKLKDAFVGPLRSFVEFMKKMMNFLKEIGKAFLAVKCCMPQPIQTLINFVAGTVGLLMCPIDGVLDTILDALSETVKRAIMGVVNRIIPDIKIDLPALGVKGKYRWELPAMQCLRDASSHKFSIDYKFFKGLKIDTSNIGGYQEVAGPFKSLAGDIAKRVKENCGKALQGLADAFTMPACKCRGGGIFGHAINTWNTLRI